MGALSFCLEAWEPTGRSRPATPARGAVNCTARPFAPDTMLQTLRDKSSGWIATVILGLLIVPFAFFGMEQYLFQRNATFVAKIEAPPQWWPSAPSYWPVTMFWQRDEIASDEFRTQFEQARQQQRAAQGDAFDSRAFESIDSKRSVLEGMIDQRVLRLAAASAGIAIGDAQVRDAIQAIPAFQVDGKFNAQRYQLALASQVPPRTPRQFEQLVREGLQQSLIPTKVAESAFVTTFQLDRLLGLLGEKRDVSYVVLPAPPPDTGAVSAAGIQRWYRAHAARYRAPETVTLEYVEIDATTLPSPPPPSEAALRQRYEQDKARFGVADQRLVSHILVKLEAGADTSAQQAAQRKAAELATQARAPGADFAALARANSDDTGSKAAGGDLGWIEKGVMPKPFEDALFALPAPGVAGPVRTDAGYHVIQVREIKAGQQVPFEQAREQLARELAETDRERVFNEVVGKLVDEVYKNPTTLGPAARSANLPVRRLGPITRTPAPGTLDPVASNPALLRAAFSETLIQDGTVSDPIEIAPNRSVLIRVLEHAPARTLPLSRVSNRVVAEIRADRAAKAAHAAADALLAELRAGKPLAEAAAARGLVPNDVPAMPRGAPIPDAAASEAIFSVSPPAAGKPSPGKAALPDGRIVVFAVTRVVAGDPRQAPPQERTALREQLARMAGNDDAQSLVRSLRKRMKITIAEDRL